MDIQYSLYKANSPNINLHSEILDKGSISLANYYVIAQGHLRLKNAAQYIYARRKIFSSVELEYGDIVRIDESYYVRNYSRWDVVNVLERSSAPSHFQRHKIEKELKREILRGLMRL